MDEVYLLWFLSLSMLICSFLSGVVPLAFRLSENKSRLLALLGSGILVGTALSIIIPEGVDSLYGHENQIIPLKNKPNFPSDTSIPNIHHENSATEMLTTTIPTNVDQSPMQRPDQSKQNMTWIVGISLMVGFVLMLLIEQFSIYQAAGTDFHISSDIVQPNCNKTEYTLASQHDDTEAGSEEPDMEAQDGETSETKPISTSNSHRISIRANPMSGVSGSGVNFLNSNPNRYYDHARTIMTHKSKPRVTPTLGLVIHAAADGIALGAAATTSHRDVEMIIFLAIMLHKAPAAFSLVVLLLHNGLRPATIRRHLLAFSLSAPVAAILTYYGLSQSGKEALKRNNATGIAMLFSAGTFLFVATVHVLPELIQNKLLTPKEMSFLLGGAFLPLILTQII